MAFQIVESLRTAVPEDNDLSANLKSPEPKKSKIDDDNSSALDEKEAKFMRVLMNQMSRLMDEKNAARDERTQKQFQQVHQQLHNVAASTTTFAPSIFATN